MMICCIVHNVARCRSDVEELVSTCEHIARDTESEWAYAKFAIPRHARVSIFAQCLLLLNRLYRRYR
jgi:hypothetical protein